MATIVLGILKYAFHGTICDDRDPFKARRAEYGSWLAAAGSPRSKKMTFSATAVVTPVEIKANVTLG
jgi:hypothetical protein